MDDRTPNDPNARLQPELEPQPAAPAGPPSDGPHLATVSYDGHFWDVYLEIVDDPRRSDRVQGRLCFASPDAGDGGGPFRTAAILIEPSNQEVLHRARGFEEHQLIGLLRSTLPDDDEG